MDKDQPTGRGRDLPDAWCRKEDTRRSCIVGLTDIKDSIVGIPDIKNTNPTDIRKDSIIGLTDIKDSILGLTQIKDAA
ncbi:MAG: hypothetical protein AB2758_21580 [Candidatus Thiodiazotropha endolucinida]